MPWTAHTSFIATQSPQPSSISTSDTEHGAAAIILPLGRCVRRLPSRLTPSPCACRESRTQAQLCLFWIRWVFILDPLGSDRDIGRIPSFIRAWPLAMLGAASALSLSQRSLRHCHCSVAASSSSLNAMISG
mmetsp:Transcript_2294/g.4187  ORF Transcript_2294/g.4187 Transcript_2294/m.4187 type:complete len:132 (-) Transcript_2294:543-938(-)